MANPIPKPDAQRRRRNAHTPHDKRLPLAGRQGPAPKAPVRLGNNGARWWKWAWATPQATTWGGSFVEALAKRAELEDLWANAKANDDGDAMVKILTHMNRADAAFGLTARAAAELHLTFETAPDEAPDQAMPAGVTDIRDRIKRLSP